MEGGVGVRKGAWTQEEDNLLKKCIETYGEQKWCQVPLRAGLNRCRKSCRLRWLNYLKPNIKRGEFTEDEIDLIHRLHKLLGNRWSLIAGRIPGRTANDVKNYWNTHVRKKLVASSKEKHYKPTCASASTCQQKINVIKPQPRTFSKHYKAKCMDMDNKAPSSTTTMDAEDDDETSMWWKRLLESVEETPSCLEWSNGDTMPVPMIGTTYQQNCFGKRPYDLDFDDDVWDLENVLQI